MTSPGARMPNNQIGHPGPGGQMPPSNPYRPGMPPAMSPSMNPSVPRMYMTNSPGVAILPRDRSRLSVIYLGWKLLFLITCSIRCMYWPPAAEESSLRMSDNRRFSFFRRPVLPPMHRRRPWFPVRKNRMEEKCNPTGCELCLVECLQGIIQW